MVASGAGQTQDKAADIPADATAAGPISGFVDATPVAAPTPVGATQDSPQGSVSTPSSEGQEATDSQPTGTGIIVICGQYEPGSIVTLHKVANEGVLRAEGSPIVGQRVVDSNEEVGFDGLDIGARYIAAGYTRGRYEEVSVTASDPEGNIELMQPPVQPSPASLGTQGTNVRNVPAAPSENAGSLGVGLPEGVTSPMLLPAEAAASSQAKADSTVTPGDVDGVVLGANEPAPVTATAPDTAPADVSQGDAPAAGPAQTTSPSPAAAVTAGTGDAGGTDAQTQPLVDQVPPVAEPAPPAAATGSTVPSESAGTQEGAGAPSEDATPASTVVDVPPAAAVTSVDPAPVDEPTARSEAPDKSAWDQLVQQAQGLGVVGAVGLSDAQLRQLITERNVTPVV